MCYHYNSSLDLTFVAEAFGAPAWISNLLEGDVGLGLGALPGRWLGIASFVLACPHCQAAVCYLVSTGLPDFQRPSQRSHETDCVFELSVPFHFLKGGRALCLIFLTKEKVNFSTSKHRLTSFASHNEDSDRLQIDFQNSFKDAGDCATHLPS